jgi:tyrosyl-tRNA synthetase
MPSKTIKAGELESGIGVLDLFTSTGLCSSNSESRRLVQQGGAVINEKKITDPKTVISSDFAKEGELILKAGKKRFFRVIVEAS